MHDKAVPDAREHHVVSSDNSAPLRRALVLGGGAAVGMYWESGLLHGLRDAGMDVFDFDAIVGTSAGSMIGAALASGRLPESPEQTRARRRALGRSADPGFPFDLREVDWEAVARVFELWASTHVATVEQCAAIGALARQNDGRHLAAWLAEFQMTFSACNWGEQKLRVVAVDATSGERRVFRNRDGVALPSVVAASCAIPGVCPLVPIEERFYMDGSVHSTTNADTLVAERPAQVLIAMPSNSVTTKFGALAERILEREVAALVAAGCDVRVATPSPRDAPRLGAVLMDYTRADDAYAVGLEAGREWANALRTDGASGGRAL